MGITTAIQWCDSTCNPAVGCAGCELHPDHCYAKQWCDRWAGRRGYPKRFESPELFPGRIEAALAWSDLTGKDRPAKPWLNGMPRVSFLCDLGDPFTPGLPDDWLAKHVEQMRQRHIWILLTKWPARMQAFVEWWQMQFCERWPRNIWLGTSVTSEKNLGRIAELLQVPASVRLVSMEPLLGLVDLRTAAISPQFSPLVADRSAGLGIDWLILGGESGRRARPCQFNWIRRGMGAGRAGWIPIFVKQVGSNPHGDWLHGAPPTHTLTQLVGGQWRDTRQESQCKNGRWKLHDPKGGDPREWPEDLRVREMPDWRKLL